MDGAVIRIGRIEHLLASPSIAFSEAPVRSPGVPEVLLLGETSLPGKAEQVLRKFFNEMATFMRKIRFSSATQNTDREV